MATAVSLNVQSKLETSTNLEDIKNLLNSIGQFHVTTQLCSNNSEGVAKLSQQLIMLDKTTPGGLTGYVDRAKTLLLASKNGEDSKQGCYPEVPDTINLKTGSEEFVEYEKIGATLLSKTAFVLVAGGLGERLSYKGIKIGIKLSLISEVTFFEEYVNYILAYEDRILKVTGGRVAIPLIIMTSDDTDSLTRQFLDENNNFGLSSDQIFIVKQLKVPALSNSDAAIALDPNDPFKVLTKPHGHGDIHTLLLNSQILEKLSSNGKEYLVFFQDTNSLVFHGVLASLGVTEKKSFDMISLTVPRVPCEPVGAICRLRYSNGKYLTINTEYNVLGALLKNCDIGSDRADQNTGYSPFPGNTNILFIRLKPYLSALKRTGGIVPEFVNPKYTDSTKTTFKSPTRLECMMQDLPLLFGEEEKVGCIQLERWLTFSACKNSLAEAINKHKAGLGLDTASSCEGDYYAANAQLLRLIAKKKGITCRIEESGKDPVTGELDYRSYLKDDIIVGLPVRNGANIIFHPSFAISYYELAERIESGPIFISAKSFVSVEGDVTIKGKVFILGSVTIKAAPGCKIIIKNLTVNNKGSERYILSEEELKLASQDIQIRGYDFRHNEIRSIECTTGTLYVDDV
ncbi:putative UDP-sugar pyrophospharylase [Cryptosporidium serpentis]